MQPAKPPTLTLQIASNHDTSLVYAKPRGLVDYENSDFALGVSTLTATNLNARIAKVQVNVIHVLLSLDYLERQIWLRGVVF